MNQNILIFDITHKLEIFKSCGKLCRPSIFCGKTEETTGIKKFQ